MGTKSSATSNEIMSVEMIETPICEPMSLSRKLSEKRKGRKITTVVNVAATIDRHTSLVPWVTARSGRRPFPERR